MRSSVQNKQTLIAPIESKSTKNPSTAPMAVTLAERLQKRRSRLPAPAPHRIGPYRTARSFSRSRLILGQRHFRTAAGSITRDPPDPVRNSPQPDDVGRGPGSHDQKAAGLCCAITSTRRNEIFCDQIWNAHDWTAPVCSVLTKIVVLPLNMFALQHKAASQASGLMRCDV